MKIYLGRKKLAVERKRKANENCEYEYSIKTYNNEINTLCWAFDEAAKVFWKSCRDKIVSELICWANVSVSGKCLAEQTPSSTSTSRRKSEAIWIKQKTYFCHYDKLQSSRDKCGEKWNGNKGGCVHCVCLSARCGMCTAYKRLQNINKTQYTQQQLLSEKFIVFVERNDNKNNGERKFQLSENRENWQQKVEESAGAKVFVL